VLDWVAVVVLVELAELVLWPAAVWLLVATLTLDVLAATLEAFALEALALEAFALEAAALEDAEALEEAEAFTATFLASAFFSATFLAEALLLDVDLDLVVATTLLVDTGAFPACAVTVTTPRPVATTIIAAKPNILFFNMLFPLLVRRELGPAYT
jgi:hypothetical protein